MKTLLISFLLLILLYPQTSFGQSSDTLSFYSKAFNSNRVIYVHKPKFYKYQSPEVKLPVIYLLDGQHEWLIEPALSTIKYLQFTHEIPQALIVVIPHSNRNKEAGAKTVSGPVLPLHEFITKEVEEKLLTYNPGNSRIIIGHSLTASFALYSYFRSPGFYDAAIANTPLHQFEELIVALDSAALIKKQSVYISAGDVIKDKYHRVMYDKLKLKYPVIFSKIIHLETKAAHNAVPIVAIAPFLISHFETFSGRFNNIALVDENYKLSKPPASVKEEMAAIINNSKLRDKYYPAEIPDLNGIASRYLNSGYNLHGIAVYELGVKLFPGYYGFYAELGELYKETDAKKSKHYIDKASELRPDPH